MPAVLDAFLNLVPITLAQSLIYAFVALGIMLPFRILNFPDLTSEGSFPLGACVCAALLAHGWHPLAATFGALAAGFLAGCATAAMHNKFRINTLLCGILVLTMLYSLNIRIMGRPNVPLFNYSSLFKLFLGDASNSVPHQIALLVGAVLLAGALVLWFLQTQIGMAMRAVGASVAMARAQGVNVAAYTVLGLGLGNACVALAGAILAQNQGFADVNLGFGVLINGLAALILGETLIGNQTVTRQLIAPFLGAVVYYQVISLALAVGFSPSDLKLISGLFVLATLALPAIRGQSAASSRVRE
ncbi:MAG: ABC transporter permease [Gammaproteobacteria bacterium]